MNTTKFAGSVLYCLPHMSMLQHLAVHCHGFAAAIVLCQKHVEAVSL